MGSFCRRALRMRTIICAWAAVFFLAGAASSWAGEIVMVVNAQAPTSALSTDEVKQIYLGTLTFWGEVKIAPTGFPEGTSIQSDFLRRVLGMSERDFKIYWIKRIFREGGTPPKNVTSLQEGLEYITRTPGGMGYFRAKDIAGRSDLREVLRVTW